MAKINGNELVGPNSVSLTNQHEPILCVPLKDFCRTWQIRGEPCQYVFCVCWWCICFLSDNVDN